MLNVLIWVRAARARAPTRTCRWVKQFTCRFLCPLAHSDCLRVFGIVLDPTTASNFWLLELQNGNTYGVPARRLCASDSRCVKYQSQCCTFGRGPTRSPSFSWGCAEVDSHLLTLMYFISHSRCKKRIPS